MFSFRSAFLIIAICLIPIGTPLPSHAETLKETLQSAIQDYNFQDYDQAEEKLRRVIQKAPGNQTAHYYLGVILLQKKQPEEAIKYLEHVSKSPERPSGINKVLGQAYVGVGQPEKALPLFRQLSDREPENNAYAFQYAGILKTTGDSKAAKSIYQRLISKDGTHANASRYQLGQIYSDMGAYNSAVSEFDAVDQKSPYRKAADNYTKALARATRPLSLYLSTKYFYDDNPKSANTIIGGSTSQSGGSQGYTLIGMLSTRQLEITPKLRAKLSYMFYGNFYLQGFAKSSDFIGHFLNPQISYHPDDSLELLLKVDLQRFNYNHQKLSDNIGATFTGTHIVNDQFSWNLHTAYLQKRHTKKYASINSQTSVKSTTSLKYLDANIRSIGGGGTVTAKDWGASFTVDYTFNDERTTETGATTLSAKSSDGRSIEHAIHASANIPFKGVFERFSIAPSYSYSYKDYLNPQTGVLYPAGADQPDITGKQVSSKLKTFDIQLKALIWKPLGLKAALGYEHASSKSEVKSLTYKSRKYYGQLSASY